MAMFLDVLSEFRIFFGRPWPLLEPVLITARRPPHCLEGRERERGRGERSSGTVCWFNCLCCESSKSHLTTRTWGWLLYTPWQTIEALLNYLFIVTHIDLLSHQGDSCSKHGRGTWRAKIVQAKAGSCMYVCIYVMTYVRTGSLYFLLFKKQPVLIMYGQLIYLFFE